MLPIVYENHCAACHPLQFDAKLPEGDGSPWDLCPGIVKELRQLYIE